MNLSGRALDRLLSQLAPEALGAVLRRFRDFAVAEDAVQEALLAASQQWPRAGVPDDPRAWLVHVAGRRMTDHVRAESARRRREAFVVGLVAPEDQIAPDAAEQDDTLSLLFMCCHPSLSPASAIALTLRAVGGLRTSEIARAFLVPEATLAQRISRAKQTIQTSGVPFALPSPEDHELRLGSVLSVLYLMFNEGYTASEGDELARVDLSNEAIRITRMLVARLPSESEARGLLSLMLLTDARRLARTGPHGELIPLDEQDRTRWDVAMIEEGLAMLDGALALARPGPYQIQAAIAALHDQADSTDTADWPQIERLYAMLMARDPSPMVALNHAIAEAMVHGAEVGLSRVAALSQHPQLAAHHRVCAVRGHLLARLGRLSEAADAFVLAAERTASAPERAYLLGKAARLRGDSSSESA